MADAAALAIPIAIGALVVMMGLIFEDIYQFFSGGESVIGTWVEFIKLIGKQLMDWFTGLLGDLGNLFKSWGNSFSEWLLGLFKPFLDILTRIGNFFSGGIKSVNFKAMIEPLSQAAKGVSFGSSPSSAPAGSGTGNAANQSNQIQITNQINVGDNADPDAVGRRVEGGTTSALDKSLRGAQRAFGGGF